MFVIFLGILCLAGAAYLLGEAATAPARERQTSVRRAATYGKFRAALGEHDRPFRDRVVSPARDRLARFVLKIHPKTTTDSVRSKLLAAGMGRTVSPTGFLAAKAAFGIGGLLLGAFFGGALSGGIGVVVFGAALGGIGLIGPDFVVGSRARKRRERIRAQLPDALDLLAVSVGAGLDAHREQVERVRELCPDPLTALAGAGTDDKIGADQADPAQRRSEHNNADSAGKRASEEGAEQQTADSERRLGGEEARRADGSAHARREQLRPHGVGRRLRVDLEDEACEPVPCGRDHAVAEGAIMLAERGAELAVGCGAPDRGLAVARRRQGCLAEQIGGVGEEEEPEQDQAR